MKKHADALTTFLGYFLLAAACCWFIGFGLGRWADSLPPTPAERAGLVAGPRTP